MRDYGETIRWLRSYREAIRHEGLLRDELAELRARAEGIQTDCSGLPKGSSNGDALPRAVEKILQKEREIERSVEASVELNGEIRKVIDTLSDARMRDVLYCRYILGHTWERVCVEMSYSWNGIHKIHRKAIRLLCEKRV